MMHRFGISILIAAALAGFSAGSAAAKSADIPVFGYPTLGADPIGRFEVPENAAPFVKTETIRFRERGKLKKAKIKTYGVDFAFATCTPRVAIDITGIPVPLNVPTSSVIPLAGTKNITPIASGALSNLAPLVGGIAVTPAGNWAVFAVALKFAGLTFSNTVGSAAYDTAFKLTLVKVKKRKNGKRYKKKYRRKIQVHATLAVVVKSTTDPLAGCSEADRQAFIAAFSTATSSFQLLDKPV